MKKWFLTLIGLSVFMACATDSQTQMRPEGIVFETGKSRRAAMDAIVDVAVDDGYAVDSTSDADGTIIFFPRKMLDGALTRRITGDDMALQTKRSTLNHLIQFSARVSKEGVVELKAFVMVSGPDGPVDRDKSEKLARYYEREIMRFLSRTHPKILMRVTPMAARNRLPMRTFPL